jgi:hypothetical protein
MPILPVALRVNFRQNGAEQSNAGSEGFIKPKKGGEVMAFYGYYRPVPQICVVSNSHYGRASVLPQEH